ncbi:hypothetical protein HYH02_009322 [Chlamydomonas schloesseri]|uniref:Hexosyltransferase n=1 Tax=Chlamydomonas schloesseri TaxID=2026947 RepID=A0A835W9K8_9CHLO|nr:hypothetical protein HYH02_009322 [Chlamydomonas schloesseri]|eukprot:KAG2443249.1 hypothetical protein HYH02_009322 [Chlamydomonas schloesseri]
MKLVSASWGFEGTGQAPRVQETWLRDATRAARRQLRSSSPEENSRRLAIVYLVTDLQRVDRDRPALLRASITLNKQHLFPTTPCSVYIFTWKPQIPLLTEGLGDVGRMSNVAILPLANESWVAPAMAGSSDLWHEHHTVDYRLMGDWRLGFMPEFVRKMGHRYLLQFDDDSFITKPVGLNLVQLFDEKGYLLAAKKIRPDQLAVTWGLPELARYFLTTHKVVPTQLFEFCDPNNINGLYSTLDAESLGAIPAADLAALQELGLKQRGGWNRTILHGNCVMYSVDWWFSQKVHRFVQLCRATGGSFSYRWNEQGVIAMLWQIFVKPEQFYLFEFDYKHRLAKAQDAYDLAAAPSVTEE